jgi:uncharacterized protein YaaQ
MAKNKGIVNIQDGGATVFVVPVVSFTSRRLKA